MDFICVFELDSVEILFLKQRFLSTVKARQSVGGGGFTKKSGENRF